MVLRCESHFQPPALGRVEGAASVAVRPRSVRLPVVDLLAKRRQSFREISSQLRSRGAGALQLLATDENAIVDDRLSRTARTPLRQARSQEAIHDVRRSSR